MSGEYGGLLSADYWTAVGMLADEVESFVDERPDLADDVYGLASDAVRGGSPFGPRESVPGDVTAPEALVESDHEPIGKDVTPDATPLTESVESAAIDVMHQDVLAELVDRGFVEYDVDEDPVELFEVKA